MTTQEQQANEAYQRALQHFAPLWADDGPNIPYADHRPLLAHYTSIETLEKILTNKEVWFSHPLFMNDHEEVRFGINAAVNMLATRQDISAALGTKQRQDIFQKSVSDMYNMYANNHLYDTYVFCMSEHDPRDDDGPLSMWRGYGAQGKGAAIVFDTARLRPVPTSPLVIGKVRYGSTEERLQWLADIISKSAQLLSSGSFTEAELALSAYIIIERIKNFAIFTKHIGFQEEREYRIVYMPERDRENVFSNMLSYFVGRQGIEPKLKLKIAPLGGILADDLSLEKITNRIILGPGISAPLIRSAIIRMIEQNNHGALKDRVKASTIPYRIVGS